MTRREEGRTFSKSCFPQFLRSSIRQITDRITPVQKERNPEPGFCKLPRPSRRDSQRTNKEKPNMKKLLLRSRIGSPGNLLTLHSRIFYDCFYKTNFRLDMFFKFRGRHIVYHNIGPSGTINHGRIFECFLYGWN